MNTAKRAMGCAVLASGILLGSVGAAQAATLAPESQQIAAAASGEMRVQEPIHRVWGLLCWLPNSYFKTFSPTGDTCWENAGTVAVNLYDVRRVESRNNRATIYDQGPYGGRSRDFEKDDVFNPYPGMRHITRIVIY